MTNPKAVLEHFTIEGKAHNITAFGTGHIHKTYKVENYFEDKPNYLLQQINAEVFADVSGLMQNIHLISTYLSEEIKKSEPEICNRALEIVQTTDGELYHQCSEDGGYWRVYVFFDDLRSYDLPTTTSQVFQCGKAYGTFLQLLKGFDAYQLNIVLPNFHSAIFRVKNLDIAVKEDKFGRKVEVEKEIAQIQRMRDEMVIIENLGSNKEIPLRVTHNDTKFNNVLLDQSDIARCVIDLDTIMPGYLLYDFGDAIRTTANMVVEDSNDFAKVDVDLKRFEAFAKGFLEPVRSFLNEVEKEYLPLSCVLLAYLMGVRFLTDYLEGDHYYKTNYPSHNLVRARNQLTLALKMEEHQDEFRRIIATII